MMRAIVFFISLVILQEQSAGQDFSLGMSGRLLPSISQTSSRSTSDYSAFLSYGLLLQMHISAPIDFVWGIEAHFGMKNLLELTPNPDPNAPSGTGSLLGAERDIRWMSLQLPMFYRLVFGSPVWLDAGMKIGVGNLRQYDRITEHDPHTGLVGHATEFTVSRTAFSFAPAIQAGTTLSGPFSVILGIEYLFFDPTLVSDNANTFSVEPDPGRTPTIVSSIHTQWEYHLTGIQLQCVFAYSL